MQQHVLKTVMHKRIGKDSACAVFIPEVISAIPCKN